VKDEEGRTIQPISVITRATKVERPRAVDARIGRQVVRKASSKRQAGMPDPVAKIAAKTPSRKRRAARRKRSAFDHRLQRWGRNAARAWKILNATPAGARTIAVALAAVIVLSAANFVYQVVRKPSEMFFPVSGVLNKVPAETWHQYGPLFREYATASISPELLAALAQVESAGDPIARTYWRWRLTANPFAMYRPASSSVGMYQMTDPAFAEARRYCIRHHAVVGDDDGRSCWFNGLYTRVVPSHAIELTSVFLDRAVSAILAREHIPSASSQQKQDLAAVTHLCGAGPGSDFARDGFRLAPGARCGDEEPAAYLARVRTMMRRFLSLAAGE